MKTIWKYEIKSIDEQLITMPIGAEILTVQWQSSSLCIWAIVESENETEDRAISIRGTGSHIGDVGSYIGTFQISGGIMVFHMFNGAVR